MRLPPPVSLCTTTPAAWRLGLDLMAGLCSTALLAWGYAHVRHVSSTPAWAPWTLAAAGLALALWARHRARILPAGHLCWDGQMWQWQPHGGEVAGQPRLAQERWPGLQVVLDLGSWMLLRTPPGASARWLAVERGASPGAWHLMRCAVYSTGSATSALAARPAVTMPPGTPTIPHER